MTLGLVCDACDALSPLSATLCSGCGAPLAATAFAAPPEPAPPAPVSSQHYCPSCGAVILPEQRFCGTCGSKVDTPEPSKILGNIQTTGRAKLILIKGEGMDGVSYRLTGTHHIAGRSEGSILFPDDPFLSPRHVDFYYRDGKLYLRDENSLNGVFIRIKAPLIIGSGNNILVGEQLLRVESCPPDALPLPDAQGTFFYGSTRHVARIALIQILVGGAPGMTFRSRSDVVSIGREGNDVNFSNDPFISGRHTMLTALADDQFQLSDLGSRNGTFVRIQGETALFNGDFIFLGQQLLRVDIG